MWPLSSSIRNKTITKTGGQEKNITKHWINILHVIDIFTNEAPKTKENRLHLWVGSRKKMDRYEQVMIDRVGTHPEPPKFWVAPFPECRAGPSGWTSSKEDREGTRVTFWHFVGGFGDMLEQFVKLVLGKKNAKFWLTKMGRAEVKGGRPEESCIWHQHVIISCYKHSVCQSVTLWGVPCWAHHHTLHCRLLMTSLSCLCQRHHELDHLWIH